MRVLDLDDQGTAERVHEIQRAAYAVEADLIGSDQIPQLHESLVDLVAADETWVGVDVDGVLAAAVSYRVQDGTVDIHRLVVDPACFRRGLGRRLVEHLHTLPSIDRYIVSTGAANVPARMLYERLGYRPTGEVEVVPGLRIATYERDGSASA